jgi:hypothetical protein
MMSKLKITLTSFALCLTLNGCGWMQQSTEIGDGSTAVVNQQQDAAQGAKVAASTVDDIVTNNTDGVPIYWFLVATFALGAIIPQPKWMAILW